MTNQPIRMGIVGCGNSARNIHYPKLKDLRHQFEVVACCDVDGTRAREIAELYGARPYTDLTAFLGHPGLELILVATKPLSTHATVGLAALAAGKHVILEKPMCASHEEGVRLMDAARKAGKVLTVYHSRRWDPEFLELRWAISQGFFGDIRIFETLVCGNYLIADWLVDWGVHLFDQCLIVCGGKPVEVSCTVTFPEKAETNSGPWTASIRFDNGRLGVVSMKLGVGGEYPRFSIVGDQGGCAWPVSSGRIQMGPDELATEVPRIHRGCGQEDLLPGKVRIPFTGFYPNLYDVLTGKAELAVQPQEALAVIDVTTAALESVRKFRGISPRRKS